MSKKYIEFRIEVDESILELGYETINDIGEVVKDIIMDANEASIVEVTYEIKEA